MNIKDLLDKQQGNVDDDGNVLDSNGEVVTSGNILQLVTFMLDDVEYGVDILSVHEILRIPEITRLPNTPDFIKGVLNLRGNVVPVVDVRTRFGFPLADLTDDSRVIVIETNEKQVGLLVDVVAQVVRMSDNSVDPPSELIEGVSEKFIKGIGRMKDRLVIVLNMTNILFLEDDEERQDDEENSAVL